MNRGHIIKKLLESSLATVGRDHEIFSIVESLPREDDHHKFIQNFILEAKDCDYPGKDVFEDLLMQTFDGEKTYSVVDIQFIFYSIVQVLTPELEDTYFVYGGDMPQNPTKRKYYIKQKKYEKLTDDIFERKELYYRFIKSIALQKQKNEPSEALPWEKIKSIGLFMEEILDFNASKRINNEVPHDDMEPMEEVCDEEPTEETHHEVEFIVTPTYHEQLKHVNVKGFEITCKSCIEPISMGNFKKDARTLGDDFEPMGEYEKEQIKVLHEYLVGMEMNDIADEIPNFTHTYGFYIAENPMMNLSRWVNDDGEEIDFQDSDNIYPFHISVFSDYVSNACTLAQYLKHDTQNVRVLGNDGVEIVLDRIGSFRYICCQILSSWMWAHHEKGYIHMDPNPYNFLVKKHETFIECDQYIPFINENGEIEYKKHKIKTDTIVVTIDHGLSIVRQKEFQEAYGCPMLSPHNVHYYPLYDSFFNYTLIGFIKSMMTTLIKCNFEEGIRDMVSLLYHAFTGKMIGKRTMFDIFKFCKNYFPTQKHWLYEPRIDKYNTRETIVQYIQENKYYVS